MKDSGQWTEEDLIELVDLQIPESTHLDYKECRALTWTDNEGKKKVINSISKDVSSFANADGGTIVYGIIEKDKSNIPYPERIDVGYDQESTSIEWLENVIDSNIQPRIKGIKINPVKLRSTNPGKVAYVVSIPKAMKEPYQAMDKRYYRRRNFKSEPMGHYEIMDIVGRGDAPEIEANIRIDPPIEQISYKYSGPDSTGSKRISYDLFNLKISLINHAIEPANYAMVFLYLDNRIHRQSSLLNYFQEIGKKEIGIANRIYATIIHQYNHHASKHMPIFMGKAFPVFFYSLFLPEMYDGKIESFGISIEVAVPRMGVNEKSYLLNLEANNKLELMEIVKKNSKGEEYQ